MPWCTPCDRFFSSLNGYTQHIENSDAHQDRYDDWECELCDRTFATEKARHQHYSNAAGHPYCSSCERMFMNENNLMQHMHSRVHTGNGIECPFCKNAFATASGVTIHLESGTCPSGLNRTKIDNLVQNLDRSHVITNPLITLPGYGDVETIATERAWNGYGYECYLCQKEFASLRALNQHLRSPAHDQKLYRCPGIGCNRQYTVLSGLVQHVESESCGVMRFAMVQHHAKTGVHAMVGRMISG